MPVLNHELVQRWDKRIERYLDKGKEKKTHSSRHVIVLTVSQTNHR